MSARWRSDGVLRVDTTADLAVAIVEAERVGAIGMAFLFRALASGRVCVFPTLPETSAGKLKAFMRDTAGRPSIIVIGDDDYADRGPAGWRQAERVARWAKGAVIHAAGAELEHYEAAVAAAQRVGRFALVECSTTTAPAWVDLFRRQPHQAGLLLIQPTTGPHPLPLAQERLH